MNNGLRTAVQLLLATAVVVAMAVPAAAGATYKVAFSNSDPLHFDEWEYCAQQDAAIAAEGQISRRIVLTVDRETDEVLAVQISMSYQMTLSMDGSDRTAEVRGDRLVTFDEVTGDVTSTGGHFRVVVPGQRPLYFETGRFTYDQATDTEQFHGFELAGADALCAYLSG